MSSTFSIGIVGARGHVGSELIRLLAAHPRFEIGFVSSRERAGEPLAAHEAGYSGELSYVHYGPEQAAKHGMDALVLALPNAMAAPFVAQIDAQAPGRSPSAAQAMDGREQPPATVVVDLSADYRFDEAWHYGLPERSRAGAASARRISNPGCYATAMQLAIAPMLAELAGPVQCFGVSGYSGAGSTPSDRNDPHKLRDNLMPYALVGHLHEREVSRHLAHPVEFMPHVAAHFRGLCVTANLHLRAAFDTDAVLLRYLQAYADEPLLRVTKDAPWVSAIAGKHYAEIGGFTLSADGRRLVVVATLDNLLKGAATQALQNLNLAFGLPETMGIPL